MEEESGRPGHRGGAVDDGDDIGPNHTKGNKQQQNNQKPAHIVLDFYGPDKELF